MNVLSISLTPKTVLLIGAGHAAALKASNIIKSDCSLTVIAKEITDDFFQNQKVEIKSFDFDFLKDKKIDIIVDATGDIKLSRELWNEREKFHYLLNCVDKPEFCDFYFGANFRNHDLCVSVSTGGTSPRYAQKIRDFIAESIPLQTKEFYEELRLKRKNAAQKNEIGKVYLIGCGPGKKENLTIKALRALKFVDIALIDALVSGEVEDLLPPNCQKIDVSKQKGHHKFSQDEINQMILSFAQKGLNVGRLKGGDPAVFGRVFEEAAFLLENGIKVEMINGVSSVFAGSLSSGITPTLRGFSAGALIVSAHLRESKFNDNWVSLLKDFPYTIIVLMAHSFAAKISQSAKDKGVSLAIPAAFISKIDSEEQTTLIGTLEKLETMAKLCAKPAILVIGEAVSEADKMPYIGKRIKIK